MTYYGAREMAASFRTVRNNTIQIAQEIPEEQYALQAAPDIRSVAQTLVHIAFGNRFQTQVHQNRLDDLAKVNFPQLMQEASVEENKPRTKAEIVTLLKSEGERFAAYLESLTEPFLAEPVAMPPGAQPAAKSRFEMLLSVKEHEMHHRGQLMLIQRTIGITPHITRQMQERMASRAAQQPQATR